MQTNGHLPIVRAVDDKSTKTTLHGPSPEDPQASELLSERETVTSSSSASSSVSSSTSSTAPRTWRDRLPKQKKIAIVGTAPDSVKHAPWHDDSWQIWITNDYGTSGLPRWDACFELHGHDFARAIPTEHAWLQQSHGKPVFMQRAQSQYPDSIEYPLNEMMGKYGSYFTSTISYMLAMAIDLAPAAIGVWGVNMSHHTEYGSQKSGCEHLLGVAFGRGIEVLLPRQSDLLNAAYLYGYENPRIDAKWQARFEELSAMYKQLENTRDEAEVRMAFLKGQLDDMAFWQTYLSAPKKL